MGSYLYEPPLIRQPQHTKRSVDVLLRWCDRFDVFPCAPGVLATNPNLLDIVHASVPSNTFAIYGNGEDKELTELVPGILNQLGPDSLASLRKLAESYQSMQKKEGGEDSDKKGDDDDDDIPDLVPGETFDSKVE